MKKAFIVIVVIAAIIGGIYFVGHNKGPDNLIGKEVSVALWETEDKTMGILYIPFTKTISTKVSVSVYFDVSDPDAVYSEDEKYINAAVIWSQENTKIGIPFTFPNGTEFQALENKVKIVINDGTEKTYEREIGTLLRQTEDLLDLATVTNPEESMKGFGASIAFARTPEAPVTEVFRPGVSDITQEIAECAPTSAANSILSLLGEHGKPDTFTQTPTEMINDLKGEMDWTPANGVLPDNFVEGKDKWAAKHGLPIRTEKVGDQDGRGSLQEILDAMGSEEGAAAELRIKFANAEGKATGGHMVTVTGVHMVDGQTFIDVSDPKTPEGTESYEVEGNVIQGYPYSGLTIVSWGFVQRWESVPTGTALDLMTDEEVRGIQRSVGVKEKVKVIDYRGHKIPLSEVRVGQGDHCDGPETRYAHYHSHTGKVTALDGMVFTDNEGCGYGKVKDVPVIEVEMP